jgi:staphyloferrin B biosynthesis citrate synthase
MALGKNRLRQGVQEGRQAFGLFCSIPSPLEGMIRAAEVVGLTALVRVPDASPGPILRALDGGAQGVVVPHVRTKADAEAAVRASRYHPLEERSLKQRPARRLRTIRLVEYMRIANEEVLVVVMIEDREGVERIGEILSVPGVDMVLEGAADLGRRAGRS